MYYLIGLSKVALGKGNGRSSNEMFPQWQFPKMSKSAPFWVVTTSFSGNATSVECDCHYDDQYVHVERGRMF